MEITNSPIALFGIVVIAAIIASYVLQLALNSDKERLELWNKIAIEMGLSHDDGFISGTYDNHKVSIEVVSAGEIDGVSPNLFTKITMTIDNSSNALFITGIYPIYFGYSCQSSQVKGRCFIETKPKCLLNEIIPLQNEVINGINENHISLLIVSGNEAYCYIPGVVFKIKHVISIINLMINLVLIVSHNQPRQ